MSSDRQEFERAVAAAVRSGAVIEGAPRAALPADPAWHYCSWACRTSCLKQTRSFSHALYPSHASRKMVPTSHRRAQCPQPQRGLTERAGAAQGMKPRRRWQQTCPT